jgi:hypothetical protein
MVSNVKGEIHGAVSITAHCGTALTGSKITINALGTWMVDLVGSDSRKDLPLALRDKTQITEFQRQSMSLHALKEAGFDCSHVLMQNGNFLPAAGISDKTFLPIGVRFHGHFGFYNTVAVRGFTRFFLLTEAVTGYKWIFCCCSKHPPINLLLWFI